MKQNRISEDSPLCRFGPGGEYLYNWPPSNYKYKLPVQDKLTRVLMTISDMIGDFVKCPPDIVNQPQTTETVSGNPKHEKSALLATNTSPDANIKSHQYLPKQQMLFSDDCRACKSNINKPKHNIRTHRKPANKRPALHIAGQGSLFDDNFKSAKSA